MQDQELVSIKMSSVNIGFKTVIVIQNSSSYICTSIRNVPWNMMVYTVKLFELSSVHFSILNPNSWVQFEGEGGCTSKTLPNWNGTLLLLLYFEQKFTNRHMC